MKYGFILNNLTNDTQMAMLATVTSEDIELAMRLHEITIANIGIEIVELE